MPNPPRTPEDLASRCEREEPSREMDAEIALAVTGHSRPALPYSTSIDAALTLVPDNCWWLIGKGKSTDDEPLYGALLQVAFTGEEVGKGEHETSVASALCAAALRARAAQEAEGG